jgi:hypothetical protein
MHQVRLQARVSGGRITWNLMLTRRRVMEFKDSGGPKLPPSCGSVRV